MNAPEPRYHAMDALRAVAMLSGILLHGALSFMKVELPQWPVHDLTRSLLADATVGLIHSFRLPLFFLIAGFFAALTLRKYGLPLFVQKRARRLVLPYVLGLAVVIPLLHATSMASRLWQKHGTLSWALFSARAREYLGSGEVLGRLNSAHLWFLYYVIIVVAIFALLVALSQRLPWLASWGAWLTAQMPRATRGIAPMLLALPSAVLMAWMGPWFLGTPLVSYGPWPQSFFPETVYLLFYGYFFAFGVLLYTGRELLPSFEAHAWKKCLAGWGFNAVAAGLMLAFEKRTDWAFLPWVKALSLLLYASGTWFACYGLLALFLRYFDRPSERWREWSNASYWIYLFHLPVVILAQALVFKLPWPWSVKLLAVCLSSASVLFLSYRYWISKIWLGKLLNG